MTGEHGPFGQVSVDGLKRSIARAVTATVTTITQILRIAPLNFGKESFSYKRIRIVSNNFGGTRALTRPPLPSGIKSKRKIAAQSKSIDIYGFPKIA